jgi:hypothetical protein
MARLVGLKNPMACAHPGNDRSWAECDKRNSLGAQQYQRIDRQRALRRNPSS